MKSSSAQIQSSTTTPDIIEQFVSLYQSLNKSNLENIEKIYAPEITFIDPAHQLNGLSAVREYFAKLYENAHSVAFDISSVEHFEGTAWVRWTMHFRHPQLKRGLPIQLNGCTYLTYDTLITKHQDYFDLGAMLYENIPVMGRIVRFLKNRLNN